MMIANKVIVGKKSQIAIRGKSRVMRFAKAAGPQARRLFAKGSPL
jgi:hypothetical protein